MLTQRLDEIAAVTRRDAVRLGIAAVALVVVLTAILGANFFPQPVQLAVGDVARTDIVAPRATEYVSEVLTAEKRKAAADAVEPVYSFTEEKAAAIAAQQQRIATDGVTGRHHCHRGDRSRSGTSPSGRV
jgi:membrane-associated HD superfamily phosphohydrolase